MKELIKGKLKSGEVKLLLEEAIEGFSWLKGYDEKIRPLVKLLNDNGFKTTSSCQGGDDHSFTWPTIVFDSVNHEELIEFLLINELYYFNISTTHIHQRGKVPFKSYITIEFWNFSDCLTKRY